MWEKKYKNMFILEFSLGFLGYSQLFTIPTGAVNIQVKEITPTRNFLGKLRMIVKVLSWKLHF